MSEHSHLRYAQGLKGVQRRKSQPMYAKHSLLLLSSNFLALQSPRSLEGTSCVKVASRGFLELMPSSLRCSKSALRVDLISNSKEVHVLQGEEVLPLVLTCPSWCLLPALFSVFRAIAACSPCSGLEDPGKQDSVVLCHPTFTPNSMHVAVFPGA